MSIKQAADIIRQQGRGNDSMLMHVTPNEVQSLQGIAQAHGGSLTVNPETGLPEAGFLENILPTVAGIGVGLVAGPLAGAAVAGGLGYATSGSLEKGLMAGLGAFGGASALGGIGAAGAGAASGAGAAGGAGASVGATGAATSIGSGAAGAAGGGGGLLGGYGTTVAAPNMAALGSTVPTGLGPTTAAANAGNLATTAANTGALTGAQQFANMGFMDKLGAVGQGFSDLGFSGSIDAMGKGNLLMASAPILGAGLGQQDDIAEPELQDSYIRPQVFDPVTQTYTSLEPVESSDWGDRSFSGYRASQGYQEGGIIQQRYAQPTRTVDPAVTERNQQLMQQAQQEYVQGVSTPTPLAPQVIAQQEALANRPTVAAPSNITTARIYDPITQSYSANPDYKDPNAKKDGGDGLLDALIDMSGLRALSYKPPEEDEPLTAKDYRDMKRYGYLAEGGKVGNTGIALLDSVPKFQAGGEMESDAFIVPADVVSALGNGSSDAGIDVLNEYLGMAMPIEGEGDGLSDDIPTSIEGEQPARVADGEVYVPASVVAQLGEGDPERGAAKLYTMLDRIREQAHGKKSQQKEVTPEKVMPA